MTTTNATMTMVQSGRTIQQVMDKRCRVVGANWDKVEDLAAQKRVGHWVWNKAQAQKLAALKAWSQKMRAAKMARA